MLRNLIGIAILKKETPLGADDRKSTLYSIDDLYFRFWHRLMPQIGHMVRKGLAKNAVDFVVKQYSQYMGNVFEKICSQWIGEEELKGNLPINNVETVGRWWGTDPVTHRQEEIDLVVSGIERDAIFCECKWRNEKTDANVLVNLKRKSQLVKLPENANRSYMLFSKAGFTDACIEMTKKEGDQLIDLDILSGKMENPYETSAPSAGM